MYRGYPQKSAAIHGSRELSSIPTQSKWPENPSLVRVQRHNGNHMCFFAVNFIYVLVWIQVDCGGTASSSTMKCSPTTVTISHIDAVIGTLIQSIMFRYHNLQLSACAYMHRCCKPGQNLLNIMMWIFA